MMGATVILFLFYVIYFSGFLLSLQPILSQKFENLDLRLKPLLRGKVMFFLLNFPEI